MFWAMALSDPKRELTEVEEKWGPVSAQTSCILLPMAEAILGEGFR